MASVFWVASGAMLAGVIAYGVLRWWMWDIDIRLLGPIVGLAAVMGGATCAWLARRRADPNPPKADRGAQ